MTRAVLTAHTYLLGAGLMINLVRLVTGSLRWPATAYTVITAVCLVVSLISLSLPVRSAVLTYGAVGTIGILTMAAMSSSFPWLLVLLPSGVLAVGGTYGVRAAGLYAGLSAGISALVAVVFRDPGAGLALVGLSGMALIGIFLIHRQAVDNQQLRRELGEKEREIGDIVFAIEIFANGRRR